MVRKPSPKVFVSEDLAKLLEKVGSRSKFSKWIGDMKEVLRENMYAGELVRKGQIPKRHIDRYAVNNLYRYSHPEGFRSCYTIVNGCPYILDVMSHSEYDKVFGYRTT
jgi:CTP synthase (UTP-ammonia lyase)